MATTTFTVTVTSDKPLIGKETEKAIAKAEGKVENIVNVGLMLAKAAGIELGITSVDFEYLRD